MELAPRSETIRTTTLEAKYLANRLSYAGWRVVIIPDEVVDHEDFVFALRAANVPLDPPVVFGISWDATRDSLQGGLFELPGVRIAFVWADPSNMRNRSRRDYEIATNILEELTDFVDWNGPDTRPEAVRVVLGGMNTVTLPRAD